MWFVYVLECSDGSHYVGYTTDVERRIDEHNCHKVHYTKDKTPVTLVCFVCFIDKDKALLFEKYLKSGSGIAFRNRHLI